MEVGTIKSTDVPPINPEIVKAKLTKKKSVKKPPIKRVGKVKKR